MKRSKHSLTHFRLTTCNLGEITPIACIEILPGDSFRMQSQCLLRVAPLVSPVMHPVKAQIHYWFVPNRLLWSNWETFISDPTSVVVPPSTDAASATQLAQDLGVGVPTTTPGSVQVSALPFRAYNKIYNEFYRDQDIMSVLPVPINDGPDVGINYKRQFATWEKDYFTTARSGQQKGAASTVAVPVTGISGATGTGSLDINAWRLAMAKQRMQEHRNMFGSRYRDYLAFLGVRASDSRLDRPEFLGGGSQMISFSEVLSTADTTNAVVGDMAGHGIAALSTPPMKRFFEEHGWLLAFIIVRPKALYLNHVRRAFTYAASSSWWQKEYEMYPTQSIANNEVFYGGGSGVFGFVGRYDHYRGIPSYVSGEFRSTLMDWHYGRDFTVTPVLNTAFLECKPSTRVYADTNAAQLRLMINHRISARRLVSKHARTL